MTNREAIELLKAITLPYNNHDHGAAIEEARRMAIAALESPRWTPCAEGLPDADAKDANGNDIVYLCTIQSPFRNCDIIREYYYGTHIGFGGEYCIGWFFSGDYHGSIYIDISVVAWMPKPAPYNPDHIREAGKERKTDGAET